MKTPLVVCAASAFLFLLVTGAAGARQLPRPPAALETLPADHWAYEALARVQSAEIQIGYMNDHARRPRTRSEFASDIAAELNKIRPALRVGIVSHREAKEELARLLREFQPELEGLGVDVSFVLSRLEMAKASAPFSDVPSKHWAYWAVEKLRRRGIVTGYPGGTFHPAPAKHVGTFR